MITDLTRTAGWTWSADGRRIQFGQRRSGPFTSGGSLEDPERSLSIKGRRESDPNLNEVQRLGQVRQCGASARCTRAHMLRAAAHALMRDDEGTGCAHTMKFLMN